MGPGHPRGRGARGGGGGHRGRHAGRRQPARRRLARRGARRRSTSERLRGRRAQPAAAPDGSLRQRRRRSRSCDGDDGPGQVAGVFATDLSIELAREHGVGIVGVRAAATHYGAAALLRPARGRAGRAGRAVDDATADPLVIPFGGTRAPRSAPTRSRFAAPLSRRHLRPRHGHEPGRDQHASSTPATRAARSREGWGVDERGASRPPTRRRCAAGVPLGGYKGYALAMHGRDPLRRAHRRRRRDTASERSYGDAGRARRTSATCTSRSTPSALVGAAPFAERLGELLASLSASAPGPGSEEVLVPGEPEERAARQRSEHGIPLPPFSLERPARHGRRARRRVPGPGLSVLRGLRAWRWRRLQLRH